MMVIDLHFWWYETNKLTSLQCQHIRSLDDFFLDIQMDPVEIAVVGCGCTVATEPVAEISHRWNIPQVYMYIICSGMCELITQIHQTGALEKVNVMQFLFRMVSLNDNWFYCNAVPSLTLFHTRNANYWTSYLLYSSHMHLNWHL